MSTDFSILQLLKLKLGRASSKEVQSTNAPRNSTSRLNFPRVILIPAGSQRDRRRVERVHSGILNDPFTAIARNVSQPFWKIGLFGNVQTVIRHLVGHLLYKHATPLEWCVVFEYLKWNLQGDDLSLKEVCLFGVLTSAPYRRDAVRDWSQSMRPSYRIHRQASLHPHIANILDQRATSVEELVVNVLDVPKRLLPLQSLLHKTRILRYTQKDTDRRDPERDSLLFDPHFVGVSADPTGGAQKDRAHRGPAKELTGTTDFPESKFQELSKLWKLIVQYSPTYPGFVTEAARFLQLLESPSDEVLGKDRNKYCLRRDHEEL